MFLHLFVVNKKLNAYRFERKHLSLYCSRLVGLHFTFSVACEVFPSQWRLLPEMKYQYALQISHRFSLLPAMIY